ncbi:hypothetical protein [Synechococcus sp. BDU 130192]|uniref:hypothetical protein n=1 Tax=Synechococcus sp. BDU 130192 TaxID=2042059 RepID=UPI00130455B3|nr:hypothetical protein [Synechococcus sp. BDU 130192]
MAHLPVYGQKTFQKGDRLVRSENSRASGQNQSGTVKKISGSRFNPQRGKILSELLVSSIHLQTHCDEEWQNSIADELQSLSD